SLPRMPIQGLTGPTTATIWMCRSPPARCASTAPTSRSARRPDRRRSIHQRPRAASRHQYIGVLPMKHVVLSLAVLAWTAPVAAQDGGIRTTAGGGVLAPFDIVHAEISTAGNVATFRMAVS